MDCESDRNIIALMTVSDI